MIGVRMLVALLGLTAPGYLSARLLRLEFAWAVAFPFSALLLALGVIGFSIVGLPLAFGTLSCLLLAWSALCWALTRRRHGSDMGGPRPETPADTSGRSVVLSALLLAFAALVSLGFNATIHPLRGLDTYFRWDGLAREMLLRRSLDFYPPVSGRDFSVYLFPEGIAPLVSTVYWWVYACVGRPLVQATALPIVLQFLSTLGLVFFGARQLFSPRAGWFALLVASASPALLNGFAIGQETGYTTLSVVGQLCFAVAAARSPKAAPVVAAALFATLGSLSREYGPALALTGFALLAWSRGTRRFLWMFILTTAVLSAPWYARNWVAAGNPFYSHVLPGGFRVNPVYAALLKYYQGIFSFSTVRAADWRSVFFQLVSGAFLAIVAGTPVLARNLRKLAPVCLAILLVVLLWLYSVPKTAGGIAYSSRVLVPAFAVLALAGGSGLSAASGLKLLENRALRAASVVALAACCAYSFASVLSYPFAKWPLSPSVSSSSTGSVQEALLKSLERSPLPATGVLTDDPHLAEMMKRNSRFRPIVYWNPDVAFLFDPTLDTAERHRRLVEKNVSLMVIDFTSVNNPFLAKENHFSDSSCWREVLLLPDEVAVYSLR